MIMFKEITQAPVLVIRPGSTEFDEQRRIKGSLDMPLSDHGVDQVESMAESIGHFKPKTIFCAPCESARQTAAAIAKRCDAKVKVVDGFKNVDHGLWHGKLIDELKRNHPKQYRRGQDTPNQLCPPGGESLHQATARVQKAVRKILRRPTSGVIAFVIPDPLAQIAQNLLSDQPMSNLWSAENDHAQWSLIEVVPQ